MWRAIFTVLFLFTVAEGATAQEPPHAAASAGFEVFGQILEFFHLQPLDSPDKLSKESAEDTLIVLFGHLDVVEQLPFSLSEFQKKGGSLLIASRDRESTNHLEFLKVSIDGDTVFQPDGYEHFEEYPRLVADLDLGHPLLKRISAKPGLATYRPSFLRAKGSKLARLTRFAEDCQKRTPPTFFNNPPLYMLASDAQTTTGQIAVLAGDGVFTNGMLVQDELDNFQFAWNCVRWLGEGPSHSRRSKVLFLVDGQPVRSFEMPAYVKPPTPNKPPLPTVALINRLIRHMEEERLLQRFVEDNIGNVNIMQPLIMLASLAVLIYGCWRLAKGSFRVDTAAPLLIEPASTQGGAFTDLNNRQRALAELNNYAEPAQALVRNWFWQRAGIAPAAWDEAGFRLPPYHQQGSLWQRWRRARQLSYLRGLAQNLDRPISERKMRRLNDLLDRLTAAVGKKDLAWPESGRTV